MKGYCIVLGDYTKDNIYYISGIVNRKLFTAYLKDNELTIMNEGTFSRVELRQLQSYCYERKLELKSK